MNNINLEYVKNKAQQESKAELQESKIINKHMKIKHFKIVTLMILLAIGIVLYVSNKGPIEYTYDNAYYVTESNLVVDYQNKFLVKSVYIKYEDVLEKISLNKEYKIVENGEYLIILNLIDNAKIEKQIYVDNIDTEGPICISNNYDAENKVMMIKFSDDLMAVDFNSIQIFKDNEPYNDFKIVDDVLYVDYHDQDLEITVNDTLGNTSNYLLIK